MAERFEEHRAHLRAMAYRMLGLTVAAIWDPERVRGIAANVLTEE